MAIGRITGPMLFSNLDRQGVNLAIDANLVYADVTNRRVGISNSNPQYTLDVNGNAHIGNLYILANTITSDTGKINLGTISNVVITGGSANSVVLTDGVGNLSFVTLASIQTSILGNNVILGTNTAGSLNSLFTFSSSTTTITDAVAQLNEVLGNITNASGTNISVTGNVTSLNSIITNTTNSTSATSGALTVAGGASVQQDLWVGGNVYVSNLISDNLSILSISEPLLYLNANTPSNYNYETGFFGHFVGGSSNTYQHTGLARNHLDNIWYFFSNAPEPVGSTINLANSNVILDTVKAGGLLLSNTTPSTNTTTGALTVAGGVGIVGALYITNTGDVSANIGAVIGAIDSINANVGAYETWANATIQTLSANVGLYEITTNANLGTTYNRVGDIEANVGSYQIYANANSATQATSIDTITANLGAYQIYANANSATQATSIDTINANLGAYQIYANANSATQATSIDTINANLGAYQIYANANSATQATYISTLQSQVYSNANAAAYLPVYGGAVLAGNVTATNTDTTNLYVDSIYANDSDVVTFELATAIGLPIGGNSARPSVPQAGQFRFNSDLDALEFYAGVGGWLSLNNTITGQNFFGDGSTQTFTLDNVTSSAGVLVSINGTVQQPGAAYSVTGNQITFSEVPQVTDQIDIRFLASATSAIYDNINIDATPITVTTANTIVDTFNPLISRSAKYTVSSATTSDSHMAEIYVTQFNGVVVINTDTVINTGANTITYYANVNGSGVHLIAKGTTTSSIRIQRVYFSV